MISVWESRKVQTALLAAVAICLMGLLGVQVARFWEERAARRAAVAGADRMEAFWRDGDPAAFREEMDRLFADMRGRLDAPVAQRDEALLSPFRAVEQMHAEVNRLFERAFADFSHWPTRSFDRGWEGLTPTPMLDMRAGDDAYILRMGLPAAIAEAVEVRVEGRTLVVEALATQASTQPVVAGLPTPAMRQSFLRAVRIPDDAVAGAALEHRVEDGVLQVRIPRYGRNTLGSQAAFR